MSVMRGIGPDGKLIALRAGSDGVLLMPDLALAPDARQGALFSTELTLSAVAGTVTAITLPAWVQGFRLYPRSARCRFAVNEAVAASGTIGTGVQAATIANFGVGGFAQADQWETRLISDQVGDTPRILQIRSTTASQAIDVELF